MANCILTYFKFLHNPTLDFVQQSLKESNTYLFRLDKSHNRSFFNIIDKFRFDKSVACFYMLAIVGFGLMLVFTKKYREYESFS